MKPTTKTLLMVCGGLAAVFIVPALLIIFRDYVYITIFVSCVTYCFYIVGRVGYEDLLPYVTREQMEEERIFHSFNGDPEKIRFYKGFKKHFAGELNEKELQHWFETHPRKR